MCRVENFILGIFDDVAVIAVRGSREVRNRDRRFIDSTNLGLDDPREGKTINLDEFSHHPGSKGVAVIGNPDYANNFVDLDRIFYLPTNSLHTVIDSKEVFKMNLTTGCNKLSRDVYVATFSHRKKQYLHREIMNDLNKNIKGYDIDHINGDRTDCSEENLRVATHSQNMKNRFRFLYSEKDGKFIVSKREIEVENEVVIIKGKRFDAEDEALIYISEVDKKDTCEFAFNILNYRDCFPDILFLERIKKITKDEATKMIVERLSENPWYTLRFGLHDYGAKLPKEGTDYCLVNGEMYGLCGKYEGKRLKPVGKRVEI